MFSKEKGNQSLPIFGIVFKLSQVPSVAKDREGKGPFITSNFLQVKTYSPYVCVTCSYLWWATALLLSTTVVKMAKAKLWAEWPARAKPAHSVISPKKLAPDTYSNIPPVGGRQGDYYRYAHPFRHPNKQKLTKCLTFLTLPCSAFSNTSIQSAILTPFNCVSVYISVGVLLKTQRASTQLAPPQAIDGWALTIWLQAMCGVTTTWENGRLLAETIPDVPEGSFRAHSFLPPHLPTKWDSPNP